MGASHSVLSVDDIKAMFGEDVRWTGDTYNVLIAVHFMATHGSGRDKRELAKIKVADLLAKDEDGEPTSVWLTLLFSLGVMKELQKHLPKSIFDIKYRIEYPPLVCAALRNELKGIVPSRSKPEVFLKGVCISVRPLNHGTEAASNVFGFRDYYATHFVLQLHDDRGNVYYVERHQEGLDITRDLSGSSRKKSWRTENQVVHRVVIPAHRRITMDDILDWVHDEKTLAYNSFGDNCKRLCWEFFCDFNIDVPDYVTFNMEVEKEYAAALKGAQYVPPVPAKVDDFRVAPEDAAAWMTVVVEFVHEHTVERDLPRKDFVVKTAGGVDMARRLSRDLQAVKSATASTLRTDDRLSAAYVNLWTILRAVLDAVRDAALLDRVVLMARHLTRPWAAEMERMQAFRRPHDESVTDAVSRLKKHLDFGALRCGTEEEMRALMAKPAPVVRTVRTVRTVKAPVRKTVKAPAMKVCSIDGMVFQTTNKVRVALDLSGISPA